MSPYFSLNEKRFCFDLLILLNLVPICFLRHYINIRKCLPLARFEAGWIGRTCFITLILLSEVWSLYHISSTELLTPCLSEKTCPCSGCCLICSGASCEEYDLIWKKQGNFPRMISAVHFLYASAHFMQHVWIYPLSSPQHFRCWSSTARYKSFHHPDPQRVSRRYLTLNWYEYIIKQ